MDTWSHCLDNEASLGCGDRREDCRYQSVFFQPVSGKQQLKSQFSEVTLPGLRWQVRTLTRHSFYCSLWGHAESKRGFETVAACSSRHLTLYHQKTTISRYTCAGQAKVYKQSLWAMKRPEGKKTHKKKKTKKDTPDPADQMARQQNKDGRSIYRLKRPHKLKYDFRCFFFYGTWWSMF